MLFCIGYINELMKDCSNSSASAMELLQSCTKPLISIPLLYLSSYHIWKKLNQYWLSLNRHIRRNELISIWIVILKHNILSIGPNVLCKSGIISCWAVASRNISRTLCHVRSPKARGFGGNCGKYRYRVVGRTWIFQTRYFKLIWKRESIPRLLK